MRYSIGYGTNCDHIGISFHLSLLIPVSFQHDKINLATQKLKILCVLWVFIAVPLSKTRTTIG